ncbi:MAG: fibronectin type III domain-containing protein [Candidatus Methanomethyliaceae archaeon]
MRTWLAVLVLSSVAVAVSADPYLPVRLEAMVMDAGGGGVFGDGTPSIAHYSESYVLYDSLGPYYQLGIGTGRIEVGYLSADLLGVDLPWPWPPFDPVDATLGLALDTPGPVGPGDAVGAVLSIRGAGAIRASGASVLLSIQPAVLEPRERQANGSILFQQVGGAEAPDTFRQASYFLEAEKDRAWIKVIVASRYPLQPGELVSVPLRVKDDAPDGQCLITVEEWQLANAEGQPLAGGPVDPSSVGLEVKHGIQQLPEPPTGVTATAGDGQVTLTWSPVQGASSYNLYWGTVAGVSKSSGTRIANVTSPYTHAGLSNGVTYYYVVTAVNTVGESRESVPVSATPRASVRKPQPPTGVTATPGDGEITISWQPSEGAVSYNLYWGTAPGLKPETANMFAGVAPPFVHTGLTNGVTYYYVVTAVNSEGESEPSSEVSGTPSPPAPAIAVQLTPGDGQITISWDPVPGATSYWIYFGTVPGETRNRITNVTSPYVHKGLTNGTRYYYVVAALTETGWIKSQEKSEVPTVTMLRPKLGDVDLDGRLAISDAVLALRFAVRFVEPSAHQLEAGDINRNGRIDVPDVVRILRAVVGMDVLQ